LAYQKRQKICLETCSFKFTTFPLFFHFEALSFKIRKSKSTRTLCVTEGRTLAVTTLKKLWKNEYFQTVLMIVLMAVIVFGFWYGCQLALNTEYPALVVVSESMLPTLNIGDVIIVQGIPVTQIKAGDIVVFRSPYDPDKRIVHRAVKIESTSSGYLITTVGDNVGGVKDQFSPWPASLLVGKVTARIPYVGNFVLLVNTIGNFYYFIIIIIIVINILFSLLFDTDEEKKSANAEPHEKKLFGKLEIETIFFLILNVLLVGFSIFNLFGVFTFWQPGAEMVDKHVTIRGMYSDLQYQATYNRVSEAFLSQGFFSYKIDCLVNGAIRPGVPTFSWMQVSILALLILNLWMANKYLQFAKRLKQALKLNSIYK
jgi:signal peptidase